MVNDRIREILAKIRELIEKHKEAGKEALLRFLNSDILERLVSRLPEPIQSEVRERIANLKDRLENNTVSDWREKAIELLEKAIARLEAALEKLPEGSRLRKMAEKALEFLRKKLTDLQDGAMSFSEADRSGLIQSILDKIQSVLNMLPEGALKDRLQQIFDKISDVSIFLLVCCESDTFLRV